MVDNYILRLAECGDSEQLLAIYSRYVTDTAVTFEYDVPTVSEFEDRIRSKTESFPWIVCELDGRVIGYAYASKYRERTAYRWSCELSVYVADDFHRHGIGKALYLALLDILRLQGYRTALACVTHPNEVSDRFHRSLGFEQSGLFPNVGYKNGRWWGVTWYQLTLTDYSSFPQAPIPVKDISATNIEKILNRRICTQN